MPFAFSGANPVSVDTPFTVTLTTAGTAQDLVSVPANLIGRQFSVKNYGPGDAAIAFDRTATATDTLLKAGESYSDDNLSVGMKVSFINVTTNKKPQLSGILWSS